MSIEYRIGDVLDRLAEIGDGNIAAEPVAFPSLTERVKERERGRALLRGQGIRRGLDVTARDYSS